MTEDRMSTKRTPDEWCALTGARILDPDGWRHDNKPWSEPITYADFRDRWAQCTVGGGAIPPVEEPQPQTEDRAADELREAVVNAISKAVGGWNPATATIQRTADAVLAALEPLLAAEREQAWDEGWSAAYTMARNWGHVDGWEDEWPDNPYRTEPAPGEEESRG